MPSTSDCLRWLTLRRFTRGTMVGGGFGKLAPPAGGRGLGRVGLDMKKET